MAKLDTHEMRRRVERVDGADYFAKLAGKPEGYVEAYVRETYRLGLLAKGERGELYRKLDRATEPGDSPDPGDLANRSAVGATAANRQPDVAPDVSSMDLRALKATALSMGSYSPDVRDQLMPDVLARLRDLGADQVADFYADLWGVGDDDRADAEELATIGLKSASRSAHLGGSKADELRASRRSK